MKALLGHYEAAVEDFQQTSWENATAKTGKFVEAVLKALWVDVGETVPAGKAFKAGQIMDQLPSKKGDDSVRVTIPRACRIVYEIASNRGARHDPDEVDPNEMDATVAIANCSWILAEMLRIAQKKLDLTRAKEIVDGLIQRRYPSIEEVEGRIYVSIKGLSARDVALLALWYIFPGRMDRQQLFDTLTRHRIKKANANMAISRVSGKVDIDSQNRYRLLSTGVQAAEAILRGRATT